MSAVRIPDNDIPPARTDADWNQDLVFQGEDWTANAVSVALVHVGRPAAGLELTIGSGLLAPTASLAVAIRVAKTTMGALPPGLYAVEVRRLGPNGAIDDAAVFNLRLELGLSTAISGAVPPATSPTAGAGGSVKIVRGPAEIEIVRGGGIQGEPGPPGAEADDPGDLTLIFNNKLI